MTTNEPVDVPRAVQDALKQAALWADEDPTYAELMGTYAEIGDLLGADDTDSWFESDCRALVTRLIALGKRMDAEMVQVLVVRLARIDASWRAA